MTQICGVRSWSLGLTVPLILAAVLLQGSASAPPPTDPGRPDRGNYVVSSSNGSACLLASMGLQINISFTSFSQNQTVQYVVNLQPNVTKSSGSCEAENATLKLTTDGDKTNLSFVFALNTTSRKYHLREVSLSASWPDMKEPFFVQNRSLSFLRGTLGFSYLCREEQTVHVASSLSLNTFQVQLQPFGLNGDKFGPAEECQLDEDDMLIPIIVGAALAGLVLIVLLAYLIGRKRSHAGYQTI